MVPTPGQAAVVRNRPALVRDVTEHDHAEFGRAHAVEVEYLDGDTTPETEVVLWEREIGARVMSGLRLPDVDTEKDLTKPDRYGALVDAIAWSSMGRTTLGEGDLPPILSPWHSAVQVEDYQVYPILKALAMPRVTLMLADDVGLGKTIEAGLITSELVAQRRVRRIMVVTPAALQQQWREELREKFSMDFVVVDREQTLETQRELGVDANTWSTTPRVITSMDYLRQADVKERFISAADGLGRGDAAATPWDLLIVDEAHNLTPATDGDDSQRCRMLREIIPYFEHRLFLTATPHNGYTVSFTGLLELLDPVRFQQRPEMTAQDHGQVGLTVVRRLKSELNERSLRPRFAGRHVDAIDVRFDDERERRLFDALGRYRTQLRGRVQIEGKPSHLRVAQFTLGILTKRLLSSSYAFARTWWTHIEGYSLESVGFEEARNAVERAEEDLADDAERALREGDAVRQGGAWLSSFYPMLRSVIEEISGGLRELGWSVERLREEEIAGEPPPDARWDALAGWIDENLADGEGLRAGERLIIFTEYMDTLRYLLWRLRLRGIDEPVVQTLVGGAPASQREAVKAAFNDPASPLRILVGTDAASEGLNLQRSCRYVFHQDIPWNPMRLEQRNGRVDRHGQAREVYVYHFRSGEQADIDFLHRVAVKVDQVREDLGSASKVIDEAVERHFQQGAEAETLDLALDDGGERAVARADTEHRDGGDQAECDRAMQALRATELRKGLTPSRLARLLREAVAMQGGELAPVESADGGSAAVYRIAKKPPEWETLVEETLSLRSGAVGALPKLVFDPAYFQEEHEGRVVYRPRPDAVLLRLGHPVMQRALRVFRRRLWEAESTGRWTMLGAPLPPGVDGLLILHVLETATNGLRETLHEELVAWPYLIRGRDLEPMSDEYWNEVRSIDRHELPTKEAERWHTCLADHWLEHREQLSARLVARAEEWRSLLASRLEERLKEQRGVEIAAYDDRLRELKAEEKERAHVRLEQQLAKARRDAEQLSLDEAVNAEKRQRVRELEAQLDVATFERRAGQRELLRQRLLAERERMVEHVLPRRYALAHADVQPAALEYWVRTGGDAR